MDEDDFSPPTCGKSRPRKGDTPVLDYVELDNLLVHGETTPAERGIADGGESPRTKPGTTVGEHAPPRGGRTARRGAPVSGAHSRRKGAVWERELVGRFRAAMPDADIRRGLQFRSGEETPDVDVPCFWLEAKHHHRTNLRAAMRQAVGDCPGGRWPIAVCKDDHAAPLVTMQLDDGLELVGEWWSRRDH